MYLHMLREHQIDPPFLTWERFPPDLFKLCRDHIYNTQTMNLAIDMVEKLISS